MLQHTRKIEKKPHTHFNTLRHFSSPAVLWGGAAAREKNNKTVQILAVTRPPSVAVHASSWRSVALANAPGSSSRWASSLLTDSLQYRDAAKARGAIRGRTISPRINFSRDAAPGSEPGAAPTRRPIQFPGQTHQYAALITHEEVSGEGTFLPDGGGRLVQWLPKMSSERAAVQHSSGLELKFLHWCFLRAVKHLKLSSMLGRISSNPLESLPLLKGFIEKKPSKVQRSLLLVMSQRALAPLLS